MVEINMKNKIEIGILFCGGCNSYFDREAVYMGLKKKYEQRCVFSLCKLAEVENFKIITLINGCTSECLIDKKCSGNLLVINNLNYKEAEKQFADLLERLHG
jgi:hypothetical protein